MRILHLLNHTRRLNGHVHAAVDLACAQRALGHEVAIVSGGGDFDALLSRNDVANFKIDQNRKPTTLVRAAMKILLQMRTWRADIVHAHMVTSAVLARPACSLIGVPLVTTIHNEFEPSAKLMGLGTRVIAVSEAVALSMRQRGIPAAKLHVVLNGTIGAARFEGRDTTPKRLVRPAIVYVGGLHPRKALPDLLSAFDDVHNAHPCARLYIVGDGPHRPVYMELAASLQCGKAVVFEGAQMEAIRWMRGADIFVLPSHADPAPLVLSEAREAGCAIVATNVDGIPQLLDEGAAGILVPPSEPAKLASVLCSLIEQPDLIEHWKRQSQHNISHLTVQRVAEETLHVYGAALSKSRRRPRSSMATAELAR